MPIESCPPISTEKVESFYLYRHIRLDTNQVFYVGIGTKSKVGSWAKEYARAYVKYRRSLHWKSIIEKAGYKVGIVFEVGSQSEILEKEKEFIQLYGRRDLGTGILVNFTDGGEGSVNMAAEVRAKISKFLTTRPVSKETKSRMSDSNKVTQNQLAVKALKFKPVIQYTTGGKPIAEFACIKHAAKFVSGDAGSVIKCCKGKRASACGYKWKYK